MASLGFRPSYSVGLDGKWPPKPDPRLAARGAVDSTGSSDSRSQGSSPLPLGRAGSGPSPELRGLAGSPEQQRSRRAVLPPTREDESRA